MLILCAGCASRKEGCPLAALGPVYVTDSASLRIDGFVGELLEKRLSKVQFIKGRYKEKTFDFQSVLKISESGLSLVFLSPAARVLTLSVSPEGMCALTVPPTVPVPDHPEYLLFDLALVLCDAATLRRALPAGITLEGRSLVHNGAVLMRYTPGNPAVLENFVRGYRYEIEDLQCL